MSLISSDQRAGSLPRPRIFAQSLHCSSSNPQTIVNVGTQPLREELTEQHAKEGAATHFTESI